MTIDSKQGPLSAQDLQAIWESSVDDSYSQPLVLAGEGNGFEVWTQAFAQIERLSQAVDYTTQALYILPWSGQTGEPAAGESYATVVLTMTRGGFLGQTLVLTAGQIYVDEIQNDFGTDGSVPTNTGRRYVLLENLVFFPGERGPKTVAAQAVKPGYGYNNPLPGSISQVENPGTGLYNDLATLSVVPGATLPAPPPPVARYTLTAFNETDMFVPSNVGQFVYFTKGANENLSALVAGYQNPTGSSGSAVTLLPLVVFQSFSVSHGEDLQVGMPVTFLHGSEVASGVLFYAEGEPGGPYNIAVVLQQGSVAGATSAWTMLQQHTPPVPLSSATMDVMHEVGAFATEAPSGVPLEGGSSWRVMDWVVDWELVTTNALSPTGGTLGMLDLIGRERKLPRLAGEPDAIYRERLATIADVVTPNAIKRALYKALGALPWCYRETINGLLPGFFYDRGVDPAAGVFSGGDPDGDFYDNDMLLWSVSSTAGFVVGEPVQYQRQIPTGSGPWLVQATGIFGGFVSGNIMQFIRKTGQAFDPIPSTDRIVGTRSGAVTTPETNIPDDYAISSRWHVYLDYQSFRGYFVVELPPLNHGEFGFSYDDHPFGAYDCPTPFLDFYDGYPADNGPLYLSVYNQLNTIRAGGVGFDLFLADGPCI